jgi:hypothetical protein
MNTRWEECLCAHSREGEGNNCGEGPATGHSRARGGPAADEREEEATTRELEDTVREEYMEAHAGQGDRRPVHCVRASSFGLVSRFLSSMFFS